MSWALPNYENKRERDAMIEALEEAASHLELAWTDDIWERQAGLMLARRLRKEAKRLSWE